MLNQPIRTNYSDNLWLLVAVVVTFFWGIMAIGMPKSLEAADKCATFHLKVPDITERRQDPWWQIVQEDLAEGFNAAEFVIVVLEFLSCAVKLPGQRSGETAWLGLQRLLASSPFNRSRSSYLVDALEFSVTRFIP